MINFFFKNKSKDNRSLQEKINEVQNGNSELLNDLIAQYDPFITKKTAEVCKRMIDKRNDDEYSVALSAFNEAIEKYTATKGSGFLSFAEIVIKRRVIDYIRKNSRNQSHYSLETDEGEHQNSYDEKVSNRMYNEQLTNDHRKEEIEHFQKRLSYFEITFSDLVANSPKHKDARKNIMKIAKIIYDDDSLSEELYIKKRLPIKDILKRTELSRKTIERNRKYIISIVVLLSEDYVYLKDYLKGVLDL